MDPPQRRPISESTVPSMKLRGLQRRHVRDSATGDRLPPERISMACQNGYFRLMPYTRCAVEEFLEVILSVLLAKSRLCIDKVTLLSRTYFVTHRDEKLSVSPIYSSSYCQHLSLPSPRRTQLRKATDGPSSQRCLLRTDSHKCANLPVCIERYSIPSQHREKVILGKPRGDVILSLLHTRLEPPLSSRIRTISSTYLAALFEIPYRSNLSPRNALPHGLACLLAQRGLLG